MDTKGVSTLDTPLCVSGTWRKRALNEIHLGGRWVGDFRTMRQCGD